MQLECVCIFSKAMKSCTVDPFWQVNRFKRLVVVWHVHLFMEYIWISVYIYISHFSYSRPIIFWSNAETIRTIPFVHEGICVEYCILYLDWMMLYTFVHIHSFKRNAIEVSNSLMASPICFNWKVAFSVYLFVYIHAWWMKVCVTEKEPLLRLNDETKCTMLNCILLNDDRTMTIRDVIYRFIPTIHIHLILH